MTKPTGPICNLDCKYCFYLEKEQLYPKTNQWAMSADVLERYVREYIAAQPADTIQFAWQGGEPTLLGVEFFRTVVALQAKYANGKSIGNSLQTNGTLIDDEWGEFLHENRFLVGISIDGPRAIHDFYRLDKGGAPSFDRVMRGLNQLKKYQVEFNTLTAVNRHNSHYPLEVYRFLKEIGSGFIQFIPVVERRAAVPTSDGLVLIQPHCPDSAAVTEWSVEPQPYGEFLVRVFDEWVRHDVGRFFVQHFDVALENWMGLEASLCVFRKTCGFAMAIEHTGDLYSCDHFVYPENKLGNIADVSLESMVMSGQQQAFGNNKANTLPRMCLECPVRFACHGECPKHRFVNTPDGEPGLNYLCAAYKRFFHHIDPYMQFMRDQLREQRPPAGVMRMVAAQDHEEQSGGAKRAKVQRNAACVCGSGKKAKRCCQRT
jgi:uncharacterized protein